MIDLKQLRAQLKQELNQEKVIDLLSFIGYEINRNYKFKLRTGEDTPSASISKDGYIKDFGSGWGGDVISLLHEHHGQTLKSATCWVADCIGVKYG